MTLKMLRALQKIDTPVIESHHKQACSYYHRDPYAQLSHPPRERAISTSPLNQCTALQPVS